MLDLLRQTKARVFRSPKLIKDYDRFCPLKRNGRGLLYYKVAPILAGESSLSSAHSNNWEAFEMVRILNRLGFVMDIVDRSVTAEEIHFENRYDLFVGIGAGNSGKYFSKIASQLESAVKIFYGAGPEPDLSNQLIVERYELHRQRNPGSTINFRRMITAVDVKAAMAVTDYIFCIGNDFSIGTYRPYGKPISRIFPSTSEKIYLTAEEVFEVKGKEFLYFGGSGHVVKGMDILLEVFSRNPNWTLNVCGPVEEDFNVFYKDLLKQSQNVKWHGFVDVEGPLFRELTRRSAFVVLPSCSEGTATSVTTCMRRGLIPVVTPESGIDVGDFGVLISDLSIAGMEKQIKSLVQMGYEEVHRRRVETYLESAKYTQASFSKSFESAVLKALDYKGWEKRP